MAATSCPVSAVAGDQVQLLADLLVATLPEGPPLYPEGQLTDEPEETLVAEVIREAALEGMHDELPHSLAVVVEEMVPREGRSADRPLVDVRASVYVERDSQKGIIIGHQGSRLREIGSTSRTQIERILGSRSSSTCTSRSPRTGSATPSSCASSGSSASRARSRARRSAPPR